MMVYGVLVALGIMLFIVYVPGVRACMRYTPRVLSSNLTYSN